MADLKAAPRVALGTFPTRIERVHGLISPRASHRVELWVKREDEAGPIYGGNKVRKLEFLLGEALARGKRRVVTIGGWGSNHALATARYARQLGLACTLLLFPQPRTEKVERQLVLLREAGADVVELRSLAALVPRVVAARLDPSAYYIAGGGSSVTGSIGWVLGAEELAAQGAFDAVYVALGSCGTAAGLLAGLRGSRTHVVAVRVVERPVSGYGPTRALEEKIVERLQITAPAAPLTVVHDQIGRGYGHATPGSIAAVEAAARVGLSLETTYTGKALAALIAHADAGLLDGKRVLFIDTYSSV